VELHYPSERKISLKQEVEELKDELEKNTV
jgi:hypothetical protein